MGSRAHKVDGILVNSVCRSTRNYEQLQLCWKCYLPL